MPPEDRVRLLHMIEAAEDAMSFVAGKERTELEQDRKTLFAVIRCIEIIGDHLGLVVRIDDAHRRAGYSMERNRRHAQPAGSCVFRCRHRCRMEDDRHRVTRAQEPAAGTGISRLHPGARAGRNLPTRGGAIEFPALYIICSAMQTLAQSASSPPVMRLHERWPVVRRGTTPS